MTTNQAVIYSRVSTSKQSDVRQFDHVSKFVKSRGQEVVKIFSDSISGKTLTTERDGFRKMMRYIDQKNIKTIYCSELSRIGRRVSDCIHTIETLVEEMGCTVIFQHPSELIFKPDANGKLDILQKSMLMMLSLGAEMELQYSQARRLEGIELAKKKGVYKGRIKGSAYSNDQLLNKHRDIVKLIERSNLPDTQIADTLNKGLSTVKRVKKLIASN